MSYGSFLDLAATLYTAIEALRSAGIDPGLLPGEEADADPQPARLRLVTAG